MKKSLSRIITLTQRDFKEILRDPLSLIFTLGMPLFMEIYFKTVRTNDWNNKYTWRIIHRFYINFGGF